MAEQPHASLPRFPIQLRKVDVGQLNYDCQGFSDPTVAPATQFTLNVNVSPISGTAPERTFQVSLVFRCDSRPDSPFPHKYSLMMAIHGEFVVGDVSRLNFNEEGIKNWAERNGALVLLPFLRESVYSFTQKTGFKPLLIPLVETSAFRVMPPQPPQSASVETAVIEPHRS